MDTTLVQLSDRTTLIRVETTPVGPQPKDIGTPSPKDLANVTKTVQAISQDIVGSLIQKGISKISVTFGIKIGVETGQLLAIIVKGTAEANLGITLEWNKASGTV